MKYLHKCLFLTKHVMISFRMIPNKFFSMTLNKNVRKMMQIRVLVIYSFYMNETWTTCTWTTLVDLSWNAKVLNKIFKCDANLEQAPMNFQTYHFMHLWFFLMQFMKSCQLFFLGFLNLSPEDSTVWCNFKWGCWDSNKDLNTVLSGMSVCFCVGALWMQISSAILAYFTLL